VTRRALLVLVVALVVLRLVVVASVGDVFGYGEEFAKGAAAKAMLDGLPVEHHRLAYVYHEGGGFAVTHLKAALFALMGPSVLANKIAAILMCALLLVAVFAFAKEHLSERTAAVCAALFVLAPFNFVRFSLLSIGTHFEALIFVVLVLHFTLRLSRKESARQRDAVLLGLSGGFGLWFSLTIAPALLAAAIWLVVKWRARLPMRPTLAALLGFAVGALPLWIMLALVGAEAVTVRGQEVGTGGPGFFAALFGMVGPIAYARDWFTWAHAFTLLLMIVTGVIVRYRPAHTLSFLYVDLYALAYAASGLAQLYDPDEAGAWRFLWRLAPFWLFATMFAAHGIASLWETREVDKRVFAALALGLLLFTGGRDLAQMCREGRPGAPFKNLGLLARAKGYAYAEYFDKFQDHLAGTTADKAKVLLEFDDDPRTLVPAISQSLFEHSTEPADVVVGSCRAWFGADARDAFRGLGRFLHTAWHYDVPAAFEKIGALEPIVQEPLVEGLGRAGLGPRLLVQRLEQAVAQPVPELWRDAWLRGCGWRMHFTFRFRPDLAQEFLDRCDPSQRSALKQGYDEAREMDSL
jgi:hypothetical protein